MTVLVWIAASLGIVLLLVVAIVVGALVSLVRVEGRVGPGGAWGRGRWGVIGFEADAGEDRLVVRVLGLRIARTSLGRRRTEPEADEDAEQKAEVKAKSSAHRSYVSASPRQVPTKSTCHFYRQLDSGRFQVINATVIRPAYRRPHRGGVTMTARRWQGRRFSDEERMLAFQRIPEGVAYADIALELDCSLKFLYRQFSTQRDRAAAVPGVMS